MKKRNITPSLLGCSGVVLVIGLILFFFFRDSIGPEVLSFGIFLAGIIIAFWILSWLWNYINPNNKEN